MRRLFVVGCIFALGSTGHAIASTGSPEKECKAIKDKAKRLQCYDTLPSKEDANAEPAKQTQRTWEKEPSQFLSVALGEKIEASVPVKCPTQWEPALHRNRFDPYKWEVQGKPLCHVEEGTGGTIDGVKYPHTYAVWGTGIEELRRGVWVVVDDNGKAVEIGAWFYSSEGANLLTALTQRFGEPMETAATTMTLNNGAAIPGSISTWRGSKAILTFSSTARREVDSGVTDFGKITFDSTAYIEQTLKDHAADTQKKAERF
jgi:hypothetical protein